jgi:peroxiredoxin
MDPLIRSGQPAPAFQLPDQRGFLHKLEDYLGRVVILNFWSAECPHAQRADRELLSYLQDWWERVVLLPIASNASEPLEWIERSATERGLDVVLHDPQQEVADLYGAVTTPHVFLIDPGGILRYQGAVDDVTFRQRVPTRLYLRRAVEEVLAGRSPDPAETPPYGCTIVRFREI